MAERCDPKKTGLSLGIVAAVFYVVCALLIYIAPTATMAVFNSMFHGVDFTKIAKTSFTFGETLIGLIVIFVTACLAGALFAWVYNKLK